MIAAAGIVAILAATWLLATVSGRPLARRIEAAHPPCGALFDVGGRRMHAIDVPPASVATAPAPGRAGDPPAIVVLHGTASCALDAHEALAVALSRLGRVVFVDRPGHGHSTRDPRRDRTLAGQVEAVCGVMDRLGVGRAVLVGHSYGCAVAAAMAVLAPQRVAGLVLVAPATYPWPRLATWCGRVFAAPPFTRSITSAVVPLGMAVLDRVLAFVFRPEAPPPGYRRRNGIALEIRPGALRASVEEVGALSGELARLAPRYGEISVPTVVLAAVGDRVVSNAVHARAFAAAVRGCRLVEIAGAGHIVHHTRPAAVAEAVAWVLKRLAADDPAADAATRAE